MPRSNVTGASSGWFDGSNPAAKPLATACHFGACQISLLSMAGPTGSASQANTGGSILSPTVSRNRPKRATNASTRSAKSMSWPSEAARCAAIDVANSRPSVICNSAASASTVSARNLSLSLGGWRRLTPVVNGQCLRAAPRRADQRRFFGLEINDQPIDLSHTDLELQLRAGPQ